MYQKYILQHRIEVMFYVEYIHVKRFMQDVKRMPEIKTSG